MERKTKISAAVILVGFSALVYAYWSNSEENPFTTDIAVICVETGQFLELGRGEINMYPAKHPETGRRTLLPFDEIDGEKFVASRYREVVKRLTEGQTNKAVDPETLKVTLEN